MEFCRERRQPRSRSSSPDLERVSRGALAAWSATFALREAARSTPWAAFALHRAARSAAWLGALVVGAACVAGCNDDRDVVASTALHPEPVELTQPAAPSGAAPPAATSPDPAPAPPPVVMPAANRAPSISGSPAKAVIYGAPYRFAPSARDPEGVALEFRVENAPEWATFDPGSGELEGTPGMADIGSYPGISISVSDGTHTTKLPPFRVDVVGTATGSIVVRWAPPTQRSDGSPLTNLAGYRLYWGRSPGRYSHQATIAQPGVATYVIEQLPAGTYYIAAAAYDSKGVESGLSEAVSKKIL